MRELAAVACGGALGAIGRYAVSGWIHRWTGAGFPWGTLTVNALGCLAIGALTTWLEEAAGVAPGVRLFLGIGLLGSFTTFSTFGFETVELVRIRNLQPAFTNVCANVVLGLAAVVVGHALARWWIA